MRRWHSDCARAWASVLATMKSTPSRFCLIMLLTALPPAPPTPTTVIFGFSSNETFGMDRFNVIASSMSQRTVVSSPVNPGISYARIYWLSEPSVPALEVLPQPVPESADESVRRLDMQSTRTRMLDRDALRIGDQSRGDGEGRTVRRFGEAADSNRPAHADLLVEDELGELAHARELACGAGQHDASSRDLVEPTGLES